MSYSMHFEIDDAVLDANPTDTFCIAKKVGGKFTTVFSAAAIVPGDGQQELRGTQTFHWEDKYRLYASTGFMPGMIVESATQPVDIQFGCQSTYENGHFTAATSASIKDFTNTKGTGSLSAEDSFLALEVPEDLHVAVQAAVPGGWATIFVDPNIHATTMKSQLTPQNEYQLYWQSNVVTDSMIDQSQSVGFTFAFEDGKEDIKIRFGYQKPDGRLPEEHPTFYVLHE